jgi:thiol:disulfide interchange protein DsbC
MLSFSLRVAALPLLVALSACSSAESQPAEPKAITTAVPADLNQTLTNNLKKAGLSAKILKIQATEMAGIYWVSLDGLPPIFTSRDGQFLIQGDVIQLGDNSVKNIGEGFVAQEATQLLTTIPLADQIIFSPVGTPKAVAYVFTDADCGYCRKLHSEMSQINAKGIEVRYLAWPRSPQSMPDMNAIWCSEDRKSAMTTAKQGMPVQAANCKNPVLAQRQIGMQLGIQGTPAIYSPQGKYLGGYMPADELAKALGIDATKP